MRKLLLMPIRFYRYALSPMMASHCRHYPTCSAYAIEAIERYGALKGLILTLKRLLRCHPWAEGGYDPVPDSVKLRNACTDCHCSTRKNATHNATNQTTP